MPKNKIGTKNSFVDQNSSKVTPSSPRYSKVKYKQTPKLVKNKKTRHKRMQTGLLTLEKQSTECSHKQAKSFLGTSPDIKTNKVNQSLKFKGSPILKLNKTKTHEKSSTNINLPIHSQPKHIKLGR